MLYLRQKIISLGGSFIRRKVSSLAELRRMFPTSMITVNASGWGSRNLVDVLDDKCFPNRAQNVFYRTMDTGKAFFRNGNEYTYIIPRPLSGGVVLGGSKEPNETLVQSSSLAWLSNQGA